MYSQVNHLPSLAETFTVVTELHLISQQCGVINSYVNSENNNGQFRVPTPHLVDSPCILWKKRTRAELKRGNARIGEVNLSESVELALKYIKYAAYFCKFHPEISPPKGVFSAKEVRES